MSVKDLLNEIFGPLKVVPVCEGLRPVLKEFPAVGECILVHDELDRIVCPGCNAYYGKDWPGV